MKRFYALSALLTLVTLASLACGGWSRPNYYVFSVFNRNQMGNTFSKEIAQYWKDYTGGSLEDYEISGLNWVDLDNFEQSQNTIIATAVKRGDQETIDYLRLLVNYLKQCDNADEDNWAYPTKQQIVQRNSQVQYINSRARTYGGTRYRSQYALLIMRTLMLQSDTKGILAYWDSHAKNMPENVYKNMMRGIYAGALLRTGKKAEACRIYAELGDMLSIKWVMRDNRNLKSIKSEYADDPNNPTLPFLVQDYVNNASETLPQLSDPNAFEWNQNVAADLASARSDVAQFVAFAQQVVKEGKTSTPALWQSAAGYATHLLGDHSTSVAMLDKAMKMKGTQRMLDNARVCRIVASVPLLQNNSASMQQMANDIKWLTETENKEEPEFLYHGNHYTEVLANLAYDRLPPRLRDLGLSNTATALIGWMSAHEQQQSEHGESPYMNGDYKYALDEITADEMISYQGYFNSKRNLNPLDKYLHSGLSGGPDNDYFNDRIGTKLIREGRFEQAINYLEKVPLAYYSWQPITAYMSKRDFHTEQWFRRQRACNFDESPEAVSSNQRLDFCRDVLNTEKKINLSNGNERARLLYDLACWFFEASYKGNCWYISRYGQSVYDEVCYRGELDFVKKSIDLLSEASRLSTGDPQLHLKCLYAAAFIPYGDPFKTAVWDENYNLSYNYNTNCYWYQSMSALQAYAEKYPSQLPSYLTRCDTYRRFARGEY